MSTLRALSIVAIAVVLATMVGSARAAAEQVRPAPACDLSKLPGWFAKLGAAIDVADSYFGSVTYGGQAIQWTCSGEQIADPITQSIYSMPDQLNNWIQQGPSSVGGTINFAGFGGVSVAANANASFSASDCGLFSCSSSSAAFAENMDAVIAQSQAVGVAYELITGYQTRLFPPSDYPELFNGTPRFNENINRYVPVGTTFNASTRVLYDKAITNIGGTHVAVGATWCVAALMTYKADQSKLHGHDSVSVAGNAYVELLNWIEAEGGGGTSGTVAPWFKAALSESQQLQIGGIPSTWPAWKKSVSVDPGICSFSDAVPISCLLRDAQAKIDMDAYIQERMDRSALQLVRNLLVSAATNNFGVTNSTVALPPICPIVFGDNCIPGGCRSSCPDRPCEALPCTQKGSTTLPIVKQVQAVLAKRLAQAANLTAAIDKVLGLAPRSMSDGPVPLLSHELAVLLEIDAGALLLSPGGYNTVPSVNVTVASAFGGGQVGTCGVCFYYRVTETQTVAGYMTYPASFARDM